MILALFLTLFLLTMVLIVVGLWNDAPYLLGIGYIFLFILGLIIAGINNPVIPTGIEYQTGGLINAANSAAITVTNVYTTFTNHLIGFFFALTSILAFVLLLMQYRPGETE